MTANSYCHVTARDIARVLFRQWRKLALFVCGAMTLTLLIIALYPRSYVSEAKLLIRVGRETVGLDPTATTGQTIMLQKSQDDELNSAISILTSRKVLERVVERVGAARILKELPATESAPDDSATAAGEGRAWFGRVLETLRLSDPGTEIDRAVRRLESRSKVGAPKQSMVITVKYTAASPEVAHDIVAAITNTFLEEHSRLSQTDGSLAFFSEQVEKLHKDLTTAQAELRDRKNAYQLTSSSNRLSMLEKSKDAMLQKLYDLELQENELKVGYTDEYPPLQAIRRQREEAQKFLAILPKDEAAPQPTAPATSLPNRSVDDQQQNKLNVEVESLNDQVFELAQLEREVKLLEGKYAMHVDKLEQARVNDALGREQITNVKIAQPATLVHKPVAPKKVIVLGLGLLIALFGGIGLAFLAETIDQTLRTADQVEAQLGLPVLASLPSRKRRRTTGSSTPSTATNGKHSWQDGVVRDGRYRGLLTALKANGENGSQPAKTIGVIGCDTSKMRSRVAGDIAIQAASTVANPVLLIDADTRGRRVAKRFGLNGAPGWREVMSGKAAAESCIVPTNPSNLSIMGPGKINGGALAADSMAGTLSQLDGIKSEFGLVVIDIPQSRQQDGPPAAAGMIDEMVLVVEAERTRVQSAQRAKDTLNRAGILITGVVLTNRREHIPRWLYQRL